MSFENYQWKVTDFGIEAVGGAPVPGRQDITPPYEFEAKRLLEITDRGKKRYYDWPVHMAEKTWVDIEAFLEAYTHALDIHKGTYSGEVDNAMLKDSFFEARRIASRTNA
jgi:hypothetical protein